MRNIVNTEVIQKVNTRNNHRVGRFAKAKLCNDSLNRESQLLPTANRELKVIWLRESTGVA